MPTINNAPSGFRLIYKNPNKPVVAVSGLHRGENPQPGSAVIAAIRRVYPQARIVGLAYDPLESGVHAGSDAPDAVYTMPYPSAGTEAYFARLAEIHQRERLEVIMPCLDTEVDLLAGALDRLVTMGIRSFLPTHSSVQLRDKARLVQLAEDAGCPVPATRSAYDLRSAREAAAGLGMTQGRPVFVKGRLYEARAVSNVYELDAAFVKMIEQWGGPVLLQQRIEGEEFNVVGLGDGEGGLLGHCAIRKMLRTANGKGYGGMVVDDALLMRRAQALIAELKWGGPFELEFVRAESGAGDGAHRGVADYYLLEINPRFPAWVGFPSAIGCNLPARALDCALGRPSREAITACAPGNFFVRHSVDVAGSLANLRALSVGGAFERAAPERHAPAPAALDHTGLSLSLAQAELNVSLTGVRHATHA